MFDPDTCKVRWSFGLLTFVLILADVRAQTPCSMGSTITVTLDEGNVTANQVLGSTSPYQASLPVTGTLGGPTGITLIMTSDNPLAPNPNNTFRIEDIGTGTRIRLITSVDRDGPDFTNLDDTEIISFQLKCTSNADTSTTAYATINVNIRDVNDNSPQFINKPYFLSVEELTPVGTTIYRQISALDKDIGLAATINYTLPAGDGSLTDGTRKFNFTSTRFPNLVITQSLDFEPMYALGQTTYVMSVIAKDLGTPPLSSVTQVNVTVTDSDDMAPAFVYANCLLSGIYCVDPRYSTSVVSGQITNPLIIYPLVGFTRQTATTIRAVDRDTLRSPLTFRIAGTSPVGYETYFSVAGSGPVSSGDKDVYTATLTQLQLITRISTLTRVEVYILATQANLKYEERATVSVEIDVPNNSPPTVTTATGVNTGYIYENSRLGQNVLDGTTSSAKPLQLIVTDPDDSISGQKTTFSFTATGTGLFNVDSNGYIYMASGNLDYETTKSATINVRVTETNTAERRTTNVTVTILVLDLNDNDPVFTSTGAVHVSVPEGDYTLSTRLLAQVDATDADSGVNRILVYSIMSIEPTVPSGFFTINTNTGDVSLSGRVTYPSDYVVVVKASDSAVPPDTIRSATKNLYVNVTSTGNNAPQIASTLYTITISEGTVSGTSIFTVPARDPDGQVLSYTISAGNAAGKFSIDSSGQLRTVGSLDREVTPTYGLSVTVRDTTTPLPLSATTTVSVILTDVNDNNPVFPSQYQFTVPENQPAGTSVGTVIATDADQPSTVNSEFTYRLNLANNFFAINPSTGQITTLQALDYESQSQYIFEELAVDRAIDSRTGTVSVTVLVTDVQDSVPLFTQQIFTANVAEGNSNAVVVSVSAVDADVVDNIQYRFLSPATTTTFNINSESGQINTAVALDYETQRYYEFFVTTVDGQGSTNPSSTATVRVTVLDQNDNSPVLSLPVTSVQVFEDVEVNHVLVTVSATDADAAAPNNTVMYAFIMDDYLFDIDRNTGRITVQSSLLGGTQNSYQYQIYAYDGGNPSQKSNNIPVTINIIRNQFPPEILNLPSQINITSSYLENDLVFTLQYRDNDTQAPFNTISTEIVGVAPTSDLFKINPVVANQASILMNRDANTGTQMNYYIWIRARDGGSPSKTIEALLKVTRNCDPDNNKSVSCVTETNWNLTVECPEDRYSIVDIMITNAGNISNGSPVNITCMIRVVKNVTPTITWKYDGTVMKPVTGSRISISDITVNPKTPQRISQTMSFKPIQSSDSGTYECVVTDDNLPPSVKNKTVTVLSQPEIFIKPVTQTVDAGSTVNISCEVKHNVLITRMFWYRNGTNINSTNKLSEEMFSNGTTTNIHVLTHRNIKYTTRYECRGENDAGQGNMQQAIIYVVLPGSQPGETCKTENDTRGTEWSRTLQDTPDKKPCPSEMSGEAVRYCLHGGVWSNPSYDNCIKNTLLDLQKLIDKIKNGLAPNIVPDALVNLTGLTNPNTVELNKAEVQVVSNILNDVIQISNNTNITDNDVENFLEIASNLIDVKNSPAWQALIIDGKEGATTVLQNVEVYNRIKAKSINSADEPVKRFTRKNLFVEIGYNPVSDIQFPNTTANGLAFINGSSLRFVLSRDALNNGYYTSYSCAYFNNVSGLIQRSKTNTGADLEINSAVLSLQLDPPPPPLLSPPLILTFKHFSTNYSKPVCSYWVFIAPGSGKGAWSSNGCNVVSTSDYTTVCECNHLTNFAILMSPGKTRDKDQVPLSIISIIGCAISIFCLSVTMIAHFIVWRYVKSDRTSLLMNLCLALIISYIIFLAGVDRTENKGVCIAVAALLHYFYLAVFFLMLTYGIELAVSVIYVFVTRSRIQWLLPLAWSLPAVVVAISLGVTKLEGYGNEKFCWLSIKDGLIWAFVGPAALVTLVNFIIILVVFKHMFSSSTMMTKSDKDKAKTTVRSLCVLLPITGITWVFGILSVNEDLVVFQYLFAIINSLQGLFISLFHCFFNHNLRQAIKQINAKRKRSLVTYSTTPKISSNSSGQIKDIEERHDMIRAVPVNQEDQMIIPREERHEMIRAVPVNQEDQMIITRL